MLRYYNGNIADLKDKLVMFSDKLIKVGCKKDAEYYCNLVLSVDKACANAYWNLCLIKIGVRSENDIPNCTVPLKSCSEFNKYLTLVGEERRMECIQLSQKQKNVAEKNKSNKIFKLNEKLQNLESQKKSYEDAIENNKKQSLEKEKAYKENVKWNKIYSILLIILLCDACILLLLLLSFMLLKTENFALIFPFTTVAAALGAVVVYWGMVYGIMCVYSVFKNGTATAWYSVLLFPTVFFFPLGLWIHKTSKFKNEKNKLLEENTELELRIMGEDKKINELVSEIEKVKATKIEY